MASTICNTLPDPMLKQSAFPSSCIMHQTCSFGQVSLPQSKNFSWSQSNKSNFVSPKPSLFYNNNTPSTSSTTTTSSPNNFQLSHVWRQIQGCDDWEDIIQPLHPLLSQEIIRYGEFVNACYKAFDLNPSSRRYLNCKYGKNTMLSQVGMENSGYFISKYVYATPDIELPLQNGASSPGRWIGYVSVSSDEETKRIGRRDVLITFRGTVTCHEWIANMMSSLAPARLDPHNPRPQVMVETGFLSLYTSDESNSKFGLKSCREQLLSEVSRLLSKYKGEEMSISIAGHSMGSSLGLLLAYDISELGLNRDDKKGEKIPITVFSFAGPRVGNLSFKERLDELGVKVLRIVNVHDPITKLPGFFLNENLRIWGGKYELPWNLSCYAHVGVELALDFFKIQNPSCVHDLENYISLLRCPKRVCDEDRQQQDAPIDFLSMAKELLFCVKTLTTVWINEY